MDAKIRLFENDQEITTYTDGQIIFQTGDVGDLMFAVNEGVVEIVVNSQIIEEVRSGSVFGEMALIEDKPRSATAVARGTCSLVAIDRSRFTFLVQQTPYFALQLMAIMADRLRRLDRRVL